MRPFSLAILLFLFVGLVGANSWPAGFNTGHAGGDKFLGPVTAKGFYAPYTPTDVVGTNNGWGQISVQSIAATENTDTDQIMAAFVNAFNVTTKFVLLPTSSQFLAQPDVPRNIIVTMNATATSAVKLTGTDIGNAVITENLTWAGESGAKSSTKAFKTITRIDATSSATVVQAIIGTGDLLGLNIKSATNPVLYCALSGTREATAPTVTVSSSVLSLNTIDLSSSYGGGTVKVWMVES
jgi:hypothetical protein